MALATSFTNPIGGQLALRSPGAIFVTVATGGGTYATASGGIAVDLATILAASTSYAALTQASVLAIYGRSNDGYTAVFTFSTGTTWNMRLYTSGASEIADGAVTKTVEAIIWLAGGALP